MNLKRITKLGPLFALLMLFIAACECANSVPTLPEHWSYTATPSRTPILIDLPVTHTPMSTVQAFSIEPAAPQCPMTWYAPAASSVMPNAGRVGFDWSAHPNANAYAIMVTQPNGSEILYESPSDQKDLFMENYTQSGEYTVEVQAFDANGQLLCSITMKFQKNQPGSNTGNGSECRQVCKPDSGCPPTIACAPICETVCK